MTVTSQAAVTPLPSAAVAVMVVVPIFFAVIWPMPSIVATSVLLEDQITSWFSASSGAISACSADFFPFGIFNVSALRVIFSTFCFGTVTVISTFAVSPFAVMTAVPEPTAVTVPSWETKATDSSELDHSSSSSAPSG